MDNSDPGRRALAELDRVLQEKPSMDGHRFSVATRALAELRDAMIADRRWQMGGEEGRKRLEHTNAVISTVLAGHFPLGAIPWHEIAAARGWLAEIVEARDVAKRVSGSD